MNVTRWIRASSSLGEPRPRDAAQRALHAVGRLDDPCRALQARGRCAYGGDPRPGRQRGLQRPALADGVDGPQAAAGGATGQPERLDRLVGGQLVEQRDRRRGGDRRDRCRDPEAASGDVGQQGVGETAGDLVAADDGAQDRLTACAGRLCPRQRCGHDGEPRMQGEPVGVVGERRVDEERVGGDGVGEARVPVARRDRRRAVGGRERERASLPARVARGGDGFDEGGEDAVGGAGEQRVVGGGGEGVARRHRAAAASSPRGSVGSLMRRATLPGSVGGSRLTDGHRRHRRTGWVAVAGASAGTSLGPGSAGRGVRCDDRVGRDRRRGRRSRRRRDPACARARHRRGSPASPAATRRPTDFVADVRWRVTAPSAATAASGSASSAWSCARSIARSAERSLFAMRDGTSPNPRPAPRSPRSPIGPSS